jgi:hypothetical protein
MANSLPVLLERGDRLQGLTLPGKRPIGKQFWLMLGCPFYREGQPRGDRVPAISARSAPW